MDEHCQMGSCGPFLILATCQQEYEITSMQKADHKSPKSGANPPAIWPAFSRVNEKLWQSPSWATLLLFLCGCCLETCSPTWGPKHDLSPVWCSVAVKHPACVDATHKNLCCQRNEASAATLEMFKSRNQQKELKSSCFEICMSQSQAIALRRRVLVMAGSFPSQNSNIKYILSPGRLATKLTPD